MQQKLNKELPVSSEHLTRNHTASLMNKEETGHAMSFQHIASLSPTNLRTGFKCEHVIIVNCDFSPSAQLLERNIYITCIRTYERAIIRTQYIHYAYTYVHTYGCNQYVARA